MKSTTEIIHSFIVRIWIEPREKKDAKPIWRGVIEHVEIEHDEDEKPIYFDHLDKMKLYFVKYLQRIGIKIENPKMPKKQPMQNDSSDEIVGS